jgi:hypothetical protein
MESQLWKWLGIFVLLSREHFFLCSSFVKYNNVGSEDLEERSHGHGPNMIMHIHYDFIAAFSKKFPKELPHAEDPVIGIVDIRRKRYNTFDVSKK